MSLRCFLIPFLTTNGWCLSCLIVFLIGVCATTVFCAKVDKILPFWVVRCNPGYQPLPESNWLTKAGLSTGKCNNSPLKFCKKLSRDLIISYKNCFGNPGEDEEIFFFWTLTRCQTNPMILFDNIIIYQHISVPIKYMHLACALYLKAHIQKREKTREWMVELQYYCIIGGKGKGVRLVGSILYFKKRRIGVSYLNCLWTVILTWRYNTWEHPKFSLAKEDRGRVTLCNSPGVKRYL